MAEVRLSTGFSSKKCRKIKLDSAAWQCLFSYSAFVSRISTATLVSILLLFGAQASAAPVEFYTLMAEIARTRDEPRAAALAYAAAARADPELWPRAARVAAEGLQPSLALAAAQNWMQVKPESSDARRIAAEAALSLYEPDAAATYYRFVIMHAGGTVDAAFAPIAEDLLGADNPYAARQVADRLAAYFPASVAARRLQGFAALQAGDPVAAARAFRAALARMPVTRRSAAAEAAAHRALVDALWRARVLAGDAAGPLAEARAQLSRRPTAGNRYDYGVLLLAANRAAAARVQMRALLGDHRFGPDARRIVALLDFQQGRDAAARTEFDALLASGYHIDDAYYYLGLIADRDGAPLRALRFLARVRGGDNALPATLRAAAILRAQGADSAADALLRAVVALDDLEAPQILMLRARLDLRADRPAEALALLKQGIAEYPDDMDLRYARASTEVETGHVDAALDELRAVLARRPLDPEAMNAYGYTLADESRDLGRARELIERALGSAPHDAAIRDSLAWVLFRQGHLAAALANSAAAFEESPGGDIGAHYGEILWRLGKHAEARRIFAEAAALDPESRLLSDTRKRLKAGVRTN